MKSSSYMIRVLFLYFLSASNLSAMMPGTFSEEAWNDFVVQGKFKELWEAHTNLNGQEHLERASDWRVKRINNFFEVPIILAELRHWKKNGHLEDPAAKEKRVEWLLKAWMVGYMRIVIDENARLEGKKYSSFLDLWKYFLNKYISSDITDSLWITVFQKAKEEIIARINKDREIIEGNESTSRKESFLPHCEAVLMMQEKIGLLGTNWGRTFEFVRTKEEAAKFFPTSLKELHERRVAVLDDAWYSLEDFK